MTRVVLASFVLCCAVRASAQPPALDVGESSISLPVRVDLDAAFRHAEATVPTSEMRWDRTDWSASPLGTRFQVHREALRFTTSGDRIGVAARMRYAVRVFARAGAFGHHLGGEVGQCGTPGREAFREAEVGLDARVTVGSDFHIRTQTTPRAPRFPNPCELTFLHYDATPMIRDATEIVLARAAQTIDQRVAEAGDLRPHVLRAWAALHRVIPLGGGAALVIRPVGIAAVPIRFEGRVAVTEIEIRIHTAIARADTPAPTVSPLPALETTTPQRTARLSVDTSVRFEDVASVAQHTLANERFPIAHYGTFGVSRVALSADAGRVRVDLGLIGAPVRAISLLGTPVWDAATNVLSLADLDYVVHGGGVLVDFVEQARHGEMRARLRDMLRWDLSRQGQDLRTRLQAALVGQDLGGGVQVTGELAPPRVDALRVRDDGIDVSFVIEGDLLVHAAPSPR